MRKSSINETTPVAIEVKDLSKSFRIPTHKVDSIKERAVHPFRRSEYRELVALRKVSFDIRRGEFFGIVGRNGSGKSTLLKLLASIYAPDAGRIRMAGRLAPFIELGVGFNPDLTARENVELNGVMMGLSRREARGKLDAVLDFAELRDFTELKLKNYSSGMMVRLAFSTMIQADADILLIDEVLAVGDASFQQKCADVLREMRDGDKTIVLVTHDMGSVDAYCHRAMLIHDGDITYTGDPDEVGRQYLRLNFEDPSNGQRQEGTVPDLHAHLEDSWLVNEAGERIENVELGEKIRFHAVFEARRPLHNPVFGFHFQDADGVRVFGQNEELNENDEAEKEVAIGERVHIAGVVDNPLTPGRYDMSCWVASNPGTGDQALQIVNLLSFVVFGTRTTPGLVKVPAEITLTHEEVDQ